VASVWSAIAGAYDDWIVDTGKQPELFLLLAFLCSFGFIRLSTHLIRAQVRWWPGNVAVGGTHVHHLVWGILLTLVVGYSAIAFAPGPPLREVLAILFGVGAGLTLDEFALWLHLKDVYWAKEGRASIDAVIFAAVGGALVLLGLRIWIDVAEGVATEVHALVTAAGALAVLFALVNVLKGRLWLARAGMVLPLVGLVGALWPARPGSAWERLAGRVRGRPRGPASA
jgi:lysyl-tRNA synthetase class 2